MAKPADDEFLISYRRATTTASLAMRCANPLPKGTIGAVAMPEGVQT